MDTLIKVYLTVKGLIRYKINAQLKEFGSKAD